MSDSTTSNSNPSGSSNQNRSQNRNRNRNRRRSTGAGDPEGSGGRKRNYRKGGPGDSGGGPRGGGGGGGGRNRRGTRPPQKPPSKWEQFLHTISFGMFGSKPRVPKNAAQRKSTQEEAQDPGAAKAKSKRAARPKPERQQRPEDDAPRREPEKIEVTSERLYVGNLDYEAAESDLFELFNGVGQVKNAEVVCHRYNQRSKGYAFVQMGSIDEAKRAVQVLHDQDFMGRKLWVSGAKSPGPGSESSDSSESSEAAA